MIEAKLFQNRGNKKIQCILCSHRCLLPNGASGICRVRKNIGGILYSLNSDCLTAVHIDPIEKKPLYHFFPGSQSFSIAAMGCNFKCQFCQNYQLSQVSCEDQIFGERISPQDLVGKAIALDTCSISYTYSEPTIFFELMLETARRATENGIKNVMVTNGYFTLEALDLMEPFLDAVNVDLKSFSDDFYKKYCGARLEPVLESIRELKKRGIWIEITTLLIPALNTDQSEIKKLIDFILNIDPSIPWHVSRFFPQYKMQNLPITPEEKIYEVMTEAKEMGLQFVYSGNIADESFSATHCPNCKKKLIKRTGYHVEISAMKSGMCVDCGKRIAGCWD